MNGKYKLKQIDNIILPHGAWAEVTDENGVFQIRIIGDTHLSANWAIQLRDWLNKSLSIEEYLSDDKSCILTNCYSSTMRNDEQI